MKKLFCFLLMVISLKLPAAEDTYHFNSEKQKNRFTDLTTELRCLVCQNQNLAESNAPLAVDLRQQIYQHVLLGQSDKDIIDYLVARYGDFILYRPPFNAMTLGLWFSPLLFLVIGIIYLLTYICNKRRD